MTVFLGYQVTLSAKIALLILNRSADSEILIKLNCGAERMKWTVADIPSQKGKLVVVTGANSGIGWDTALELARAGGKVILTARSEAKGRDAVGRILEQLPTANVRAEILDLASLASVRSFAAKINNGLSLDLLVNNAGVMAVPKRQLTADGFERQFGTNFLGHFALTGLLLPALLRAPSARVTTVSSIAAKLGLKRINFDDLQWQQNYNPWRAYCQSKLADLMLALELSRCCAAKGIRLLSNAAHPGIARTNLQVAGRGKPPSVMQKMVSKVVSQSAAHGALPTLRAATETDAGPGSYYGPDGAFQFKGNAIHIPMPERARDEAAARRLWEIAETLTGVKFPA
jgi:NAD(P)-dependent dehydrogenase (short-subunit alcohol dehydrogenase family)